MKIKQTPSEPTPPQKKQQEEIFILHISATPHKAAGVGPKCAYETSRGARDQCSETRLSPPRKSQTGKMGKMRNKCYL